MKMGKVKRVKSEEKERKSEEKGSDAKLEKKKNKKKSNALKEALVKAKLKLPKIKMKKKRSKQDDALTNEGERKTTKETEDSSIKDKKKEKKENKKKEKKEEKEREKKKEEKEKKRSLKEKNLVGDVTTTPNGKDSLSPVGTDGGSSRKEKKSKKDKKRKKDEGFDKPNTEVSGLADKSRNVEQGNQVPLQEDIVNEDIVNEKMQKSTPSARVAISLDKNLENGSSGDDSLKELETRTENGSSSGKASGSAAKAFQRVNAEDWLGKKGSWRNDYESTFGNGGWGYKAQQILGQVRGKDFRHEKTKKKRGSYRGGSIDPSATFSYKFDSDDD